MNQEAGPSVRDQATPVPVPSQAPAIEGYASFGGGNLWYWDTGGPGEPVVLMHAATGSGHSWLYQQPVFAAAGYRVIGYSRRGHRNSDPGPDDNLGTFADDLQMLVDHWGLKRFHLVGTAAGSIGAADYALTQPERLLSLSLTCSIITTGHAEFVSRNSALRPAQWDTLPHSFQELGPSYRSVDPLGTATWTAEAELTPPISRRQGTRSPVTADGLASLTVPILLATGDADPYMPPAMMREMSAKIPNAELEIFTDSGHKCILGKTGPIQQNRAEIHAETPRPETSETQLNR